VCERENASDSHLKHQRTPTDGQTLTGGFSLAGILSVLAASALVLAPPVDGQMTAVTSASVRVAGKGSDEEYEEEDARVERHSRARRLSPLRFGLGHRRTQSVLTRELHFLAEDNEGCKMHL